MASLTAAFSILPYSIYLKWLMLLVPAVMLVFWHRASLKYFKPLIDQPDAEVQRALFKLSTTRSLVIIGLWLMLSFTMIVYDIRYPVVDASTVDADYSPAISQETAPTTPPPTTAATNQAEGEPYMDLMKSRYEDAFLSFFYLKQCKMAVDQDYQTIYKAFATQVQKAGMPRTMVEDTVSAALGSYETVYSGASCKEQYVQPIRSQFQAMLQALNTPTPAN